MPQGFSHLQTHSIERPRQLEQLRVNSFTVLLILLRFSKERRNVIVAHLSNFSLSTDEMDERTRWRVSSTILNPSSTKDLAAKRKNTSSIARTCKIRSTSSERRSER
eukprot:GABV01009179.1.p2 GENE.GABV01009179.1~~GABV01009179.1.p2  ORF type:complete len:107 (-),score=25.27 GABV01009179.1:223-543(-)